MREAQPDARMVFAVEPGGAGAGFPAGERAIFVTKPFSAEDLADSFSLALRASTHATKPARGES